MKNYVSRRVDHAQFSSTANRQSGGFVLNHPGNGSDCCFPGSDCSHSQSSRAMERPSSTLPTKGRRRRKSRLQLLIRRLLSLPPLRLFRMWKPAFPVKWLLPLPLPFTRLTACPVPPFILSAVPARHPVRRGAWPASWRTLVLFKQAISAGYFLTLSI